MVEGLYRGWDELRTVPAGQQSGLRVIVLFTDGASNGVPPTTDGAVSRSRSARGTSRSASRSRRPDVGPAPYRRAVRHADRRANPGVSADAAVELAFDVAPYPLMPVQTWHTHHRSAGIPTQFPLQTAALTVNGAAQTASRGLRNQDAGAGRYPGGGLQHQQRGAQCPRDHRQRSAQRQRRLQDPYLHDRHGRARAQST